MGLGFLALAFIIPLTSAVGSTFIKWKLSHVPAVPLSASFLGVAGLSLAPLEFFPQQLAAWHLDTPANATPSLQAFALLVLLGVIGTGISTSVFVWMIDKKGPLFAGMTTYVVPLLALLWGHFDKERISTSQLIAMVAIFSMVALVQFDPARSKKRRRNAADALPASLEQVIMTAEPPAGSVVLPAPALAVSDPPATPHQAA
jgi:drug/metabolite transporter (DMT)-like permease